MSKNLNDLVMRLYPPLGTKLTPIKAQDAIITTKEYGDLIDFQSGVWTTNIGHSRSEITDVIKNCVGSLMNTHQYFETEHPNKLVEELVLASGLIDKYNGMFLLSGSEAVLCACGIARELTGKEKLLSFSNSYHGAMGELRVPRNKGAWTDIDVADCFDCNNNCKDCDKLKSINYNDYAAFVFEPGNSGGLVLCHPEKLVTFISDNIRNAGGYIVVNEVTTGFGRTGKWFGHQHYSCMTKKGLNPDFIAMGKALGNGYPISGVLAKVSLAKGMEQTGYKYIQSHQNDPLGCIVARKVIELISRDNLIETGKQRGEYLVSKLEKIKRKNPSIESIRNRGLMTVVFLDKNISSRKIHSKLLVAGIFTAFNESMNFLHLYPPITILEEQIDFFCNTLNSIL